MEIYLGSSPRRSGGSKSMKFRNWPYAIDPSVSTFKNFIIAAALLSVAGSPAFRKEANT
jgi:hypothetical protein